MATRQEQFFAEVYAGARQAGLSDAQARLAASQSSLETGFGKSMPGGNMFGIKAGKSWTGPTQNLNTWEDVGGRVNIVDKFRSYANPFDSLGDWAGLLERRFPEASAASSFTDAVGGLRAGQPGGYATDRNYNSKLNSIDQRFGEVAQQNYGLMGREIPTPSMAPRGVMNVLGSSPEEVAAYVDGGLRNASFPATQAPVERGGLLADPSFDMGRFGDPAPSQVASFDAGRFGSTSPNVSYDQMISDARATRQQPVDVALFDSGRFGTMTTQPQGVSGLREGLLASNAAMAQPQGIISEAAAAQPSLAMAKMDRLPAATTGPASFQGPVAPGMQPAMDAANLGLDVMDQRASLGLPAVQQPSEPSYTDPMVTTAQPAQASPATPAQAAPMSGGLLAEQPTGGFGPSMTVEEADRMKRSLQMRTLGGGVLGGLLGGFALGPVGGLIGGYAGRQMGAKSYFPDAPKGGTSNKGSDRDSLSSKGRDIARDSKQFDRAVSSGKGGLW